MKRILAGLPAATLIAATFTASDTYAASITQTFSFLSEDTDRSFLFDAFDPQLGTLSSVDFSLSAFLSIGVSTPWHTTDNTVIESPPGAIHVDISRSAYLNGNLLGSVTEGIHGACTTSFTSPASSGTCSDGTGGPRSIYTTFTSDLNPFSATGTVSVSVTSSFIYGTESYFGELIAFDDPTFLEFQNAGSVSLTYNYSPVPVPAAVWLFGSGLLGLLGALRTQRQR